MRNILSVFILSVLFSFSCNNKSEMQSTADYYTHKNLMLNYSSPVIALDSINLKQENGASVRLSDIKNTSGKLYFIYSQMNCLTCVETVLKVIHDEFPELFNNMVIVSSYESLRNLSVFKRVNNYDGEIYNDYSGSFTNNFKQDFLPGLFLIHPDGKVYSFLWADKSQTEMLRNYLSAIKKQLKYNEVL
jgi:hypothetical protein